MSEFIRCPSCGLIVSTRRSAACPRCARPVPGSTAPLAARTVPAAAASAPAVPSRPAPAATQAAAPAKGKIGAAASAAGAVISIAISKMISKAFGVALLFPTIFGLLAFAILAKVGPRRARPFFPAAAVLIGHAGWMISGAVVTGKLGGGAIDLVLVVGGIAWLLARPGLAPAIALAIFEVLSAAVNVWQLTSGVAAGLEAAMALHLVLRAAVLAGLALGYAKLRGERTSAARTALAQTFE